MHFHWKIGIFQTLLLELAGEGGEGLAALRAPFPLPAEPLRFAPPGLATLRVPFPFPLAAGALAWRNVS